MSDERIQTNPIDDREKKDRYAVYAGRLAAAVWSLVASMIAGLFLIKHFHEHIEMMVGLGIIVFYIVIPSVTIVPLLGIAALIFGIRGWSRDRIVAPDDFDRARFGVVTGILTTVWFVLALSCALWNSFSPTPVPNNSTSKPTSTSHK
jgi:hypothetical protein